MRLELIQNAIKSDLQSELGIKGFLETFNREIPLIPLTILKPLNKEEGKAHFKQLERLLSLHNNKEIAIDQLVSIGKKLPQLDSLLPFLKNGELEQFHLYQLFQFLIAERDLVIPEGKDHPLPADTKTIDKLIEMLGTHTQDEASSLKLTPTERLLRDEIHSLDHTFNQLLKGYEEKITETTTLRMIYPYPKELNCKSKEVAKASKSELLEVFKEGDRYIIDYCLTPELLKLQKEKEDLNSEFKLAIDLKLERINAEISPYTESFTRLYNARKERLLQYALCLGTIDHDLCLPSFTNQLKFTIENGILPILSEGRKDKYIPLSIDLKKGANILYGSNMSGKTTVLKTLYFHLSCVKFGLPIPASKVELKYPSQISIQLKSSGSLENNISSFGEELEFFSQQFTDDSYIFSDELFQSTNPESGTTLCEITCDVMSQKEIIFFASTHYPQVLDRKNISLYKMKDMDFGREIDRDLSINDLIGKMPFEVRKVTNKNQEQTKQEGKTPLKIAMHFPLSNEFKSAIRKKLT